MPTITYIGTTNYQSKYIRFGIKEADRAGHIYCIGKTGVGKSTLLLNMAISDIEHGNGLGIIDPHGDISEEILDYVPKTRIKDVIYFNPADTCFPISFNPFSDVSNNQHHLVASNLVGTLKKIWVDSWGPRLEHILRNCILTLLTYPEANILRIQPLLTNCDFRNEVLHYVTDSSLLNFWYKEFYPMPPAMKAEVISPIINKIGLFQTHPLIRNIIGQNKSSFSISEVMDNKKIFIANLSKGVLGEDGTQLLGALLVTQFQTAAMERIHQPVANRIPFYLYIDEAHSFVTLAFCDLFSEVRKFRLCLFLTHQYIEQLNEKVRAAIFGNVGTLICFRVGAQDGKILEEEFKQQLTAKDLVNLPQYEIYLKLLIDGATSQPFSASTFPPPLKRKSSRREIIEYSRKMNGNIEHEKTYKSYEQMAAPKKYVGLFD